ncbi:alpha-amylase family glycosyl hydrolase [Marvinbryantia sp.]|uniref:alpha-amylase family glycosyl hydrolase n=1 Tax=Marvinbryantia sp. TaxID=2496532 RepID=UPI0025FB6508|nr:alpha-amylase family glycosyl hydrolase [uncultured Marvinbryantia sp.]
MSKWYEEAVFYHMYPLGMTGAPKYNTQEEVTHRFDELEDWLPHLQDIGCTAIYIGPLFESTSHGYDTRDYRLVDRRLGDNEDFKQFVQKAHDLGIHVVVDGVFNHTGREFFAFKDIQQNRERSPYCSWYKGINFGWNTHYNDGFGYEAWRNCFELVNLNLYERAVKDYLFDVIRFWIHEFDIDGIRLDCADCLDFDFMKEMRWMTAQEKEDFWLMGEVIHGDYARWANDDVLHSVTNYELHKGLYSGHNDHNYFEIAHTIRREFDENGGIYRGRKLYSFVDNHDVDRIMSKLNNKEHIFSVYTLLYTLPGIPSIYYGSEFGVEGRKEGPNDDPMRPRLLVGECLENNRHPELTEYIRMLGKLRKDNEVLADGKYRELYLTTRQYAYARILGERAVIVAANNDDAPAWMEVSIPVGADKVTDFLTGEEKAVENGRIRTEVQPGRAVIYVTK